MRSMILLVALLLPLAAGAEAQRRTLTVKATAYNSTPAQTDQRPHVGAWGDRLDRLPPGQRAIAVSPDLVRKGLRHKTRVRIQGLDGEFVVLDRTSSDARNRIDIFMAKDVAAAKRFGRKSVQISW